MVILGNDYEMFKVQNKDESIHSGRTSLKRSIFLGDFILHITHKNICIQRREYTITIPSGVGTNSCSHHGATETKETPPVHPLLEQ